MTRPILPRNNFFDGQEISETDLDVEQTAWHSSLANDVDFLAGSGIEKEFTTQTILFDTDNVPASVQTLLDNETFDGEPIYETDSFGLTIFDQPSDTTSGNQLEVEMSEADLDGAPKSKVYIFGLIYGDVFTQEVLVFEKNESQITRNYFTNIIAIMTQDFRGNQNTIVDGVSSASYNGRLRILEALPMTLARDCIMVEQAVEPNMDYVNFKPATPSKTLDTILNEIADYASVDVDSLAINVTSTTTRSLNKNETGIIIGQKFKATTNNIQKVSVLLSIEENTLALSGHEFDWSGDIVLGIRKLQTSTQCSTDVIPNSSIDFDPEPAPIAEISFNQDSLADLGIILDDSPQVVDFVFTQSILANPNIELNIEPNEYYMLTLRRSGNISTGNIVLFEAANTTTDPTLVDDMRMSVFSQNTWVDISDSDLWFKVYTNAVRITDGTAFDSGVQVTSPKTKKNASTGLQEPYIEGYHSLVDVSQTAKNYLMIQKATSFTDSIPHPATGNLVATRIEDVPDIAVVNESTLTELIDAGNEPIIIGSARDTNPANNPSIIGTTYYPGLLRSNTFTIINPTSDITLNNLEGSILIPNTNKVNNKYRIIKVEVFEDAYGDINNDGLVNLTDVALAQTLDGYSKNLEDGTIDSSQQLSAIVQGTVTMEQILRADVNADGVINLLDPQEIQQNIILGTAFEAGSTFKRAVLTVESLTSPLTSSVDMLSSDSAFNTVPFVNIEFQIDFTPTWYPYNLEIIDLRRFLPKTFTELTSSDITGDDPNGGKNVSFIPGDILLGGEIKDLDGNTYSIDLEVNSIVISLPEGSTQGEVDIFTNFIKDKMYFYDGTLVKSGALESGQVKVLASIQSFVKDTDGYDLASIDGNDPIDTTIAILYTQESGILRIRANNIRYISTRPELRTKLVLTVYLKKAGFKNTETAVTPTELQELLISI